MRVIVQGYGVVGTCTARILAAAGHEVVPHDPALGHTAEGHADVLVICTPCLDGFLDPLPDTCTWDQVVVRSSVVPNAFVVLDCPVHHWPEFLTEATAEADALSPDKLVWGHDGAAPEAFARELLGAHYDKAPVLHCSLQASSLIKLGINTIYTTKVLLANALYDAVGEDPKEYESVCWGLHLDQRITLTHTNIHQDGYRGAGGKCLPKDTRNLLRVLEGTIGGRLVRALVECNNLYRGLGT